MERVPNPLDLSSDKEPIESARKGEAELGSVVYLIQADQSDLLNQLPIDVRCDIIRALPPRG